MSEIKLSWRPTARRVAILAALGILTACAQQQSVEMPVEAAINELAKQEAASADLPDAVSAALLPGASELLAAETGSERFNLAVRDVPARSFFLGLVKGTGINVVVHPNVKGSISLELNSVTIADVMNVTRDIYGYEFKRQNGIYTVYPSELRTEIFHVNYLDVKRVGISDTSVKLGDIVSSDSNRSNNSNNRGGNNNGANGGGANLLSYLDEEAKGGGGQQSISGSRVQTLNKTDFWGSLRSTLSAIIGGERDERLIMVTPQAGMVVVKALPQELNSVREFLERAELSVKRQVILEAKILEVRLSEGYEAGIDWTAINGQILLGNNVSQFTSPSEITEASESVGEIFSSLIKVADITDLLSLLETQGNVQVLSSPRISTVNNQKAVIRVGSDEFFVTGISSNTTSNANSTTSTPNIELASFFSGIALDVTPQIAENGEVILHIHPVVSDVQDQLKEFTVGDEKFSLPLALRDVRESDSIVRARSGEVVVLGGLMQDSLIEQDGKNVGLGDVPLLNAFFKTKKRQSVKTELVILLRPIVVGEGSWKNAVSESQQSIQRLNNQYRKEFR